MLMGALQCLFSAGGWEQLWLRGVTKGCSQKEWGCGRGSQGEEATLAYVIIVIAETSTI